MKKIITFLAALIILLHILSFSFNAIGIDQLIPCILGYLTIWAIFMMIEFKSEEPFEGNPLENPDEYKGLRIIYYSDGTVARKIGK